MAGSTVLAPYNKISPEFESVPPLLSAPGYVARIGLDDPTLVEAALLRAESYYLAADFTTRLLPLVLVLHGSEVAIFFRENYPRCKAVVDLAARVCFRRRGHQGV